MQEVHDAIRSASVGFAISATLIIAIGAQNAFVLRQGLLRQHVGTIVLFCATADACLMAAGVWGLGQVLERAPGLGRWLTVAGVPSRSPTPPTTMSSSSCTCATSRVGNSARMYLPI